MKEFTKWWANTSADYLSDIEVEMDGRLEADGWKAALEWVLKEGNCDPGCGYKDIIKEELNG